METGTNTGSDMTFIETHCGDCLNMPELGETFEFVHRWLDGIEPPYDTTRPDPRHHMGGIEQVRKMWGDKAAKAAEIHILRDTGGRIPTEEEARSWTTRRKDKVKHEADEATAD